MIMTNFQLAPLMGLLAVMSVSTVYAQDFNVSEKPALNISAQMPERWVYQPVYMQTAPSADAWWRQYGDALLDSLIIMAEANNYNAGAAVKRIALAERQIAAARSSLYPTIGVSADWTRAQTAGAMTKPVTASHSTSYFNVGANLSWEIDIFGRVAAKTKAARAGVEVSRAEYDGVIVSLCADVASAYFQLRTYQGQYRVALAHIASQEEVVKMTQVRYDAGLANALEVSQAKTVLYSTRASLPSIESAIRTTANSIAILVGEFPSEVMSALLGADELPPAPPVLAPSAPLELLRRRPDVVQAEMQLARYAAQVGVAKKDFLPVLTLDGSIGTSAHNAGNLFGSHSLEYSVAPTLSWTVFNGFARKNTVAEARLQLEAATDDYNMTVLTAVEEVENAISNYNAAVERVAALKGVVDESEKGYKLSVELYKDDLSDFINVVNSQLTYLENQNALVEANGNVYAAQVALYQALGGGINF